MVATANEHDVAFLEVVHAQMQKIDPFFEYSAVQTNDGLRSNIHFDKGNLGDSYINVVVPFAAGWTFRSVNSGELEVFEPGTWQKFNGLEPHGSTPFCGRRISTLRRCTPSTGLCRSWPRSAFRPKGSRRAAAASSNGT